MRITMFAFYSKSHQIGVYGRRCWTLSPRCDGRTVPAGNSKQCHKFTSWEWFVHVVTLLCFSWKRRELLWDDDVKSKSVCFQIQECLSLGIRNKQCNSFACVLIQGTREMSAYFCTYYELIITTRLFFKDILKIFSLTKQSMIGKANKSVFKGLLSYYPYCNWLLQALMMDEHIRTARI